MDVFRCSPRHPKLLVCDGVALRPEPNRLRQRQHDIGGNPTEVGVPEKMRRVGSGELHAPMGRDFSDRGPQHIAARPSELADPLAAETPFDFAYAAAIFAGWPGARLSIRAS
jgi:hypothetical protein